VEPSILVAEDDAVSRTALERLLRRLGYAVESVRDGAAAWRVLRRPDAPRLAILDWLMPGLDGLEVCRKLRRERPEPYTWILMLTARDHKRHVVEGLRAGADDYLVKPYDRQELAARLAVGQRLLALERELVAARERFGREASEDLLTGVANRRGGEAALHRNLARCARNGEPLAIGLLDLDHFKAINDSHGHATGDRLLAEVAERLRSSLRAGDEIARWGGEEFLVVLPNTGPATAAEIAERLRIAISQQTVPGRPELLVTTSIGFAVASPDSWCDVAELLERADRALYRAKAEGRDRVVVDGMPGGLLASPARSPLLAGVA
jgi:diguanylate cyclase (GGDEF)-like protein